MEQRWFGDIPLWGRFDTFRGDRPAIFVIRGVFSEPDVLYEVPDMAPHADVAFAHLPGMHSPHIAEPSIERFAQVLEATAQSAFQGRPINVVGNSIGGLVALAFRSARTVIALEPPLLTAGLWPMRNLLREKGRGDLAMSEWIWSVFGVAPDGLWLPRDYRTLLDAQRAPICVVLGGNGLEPERPFNRMPSLVSAEAREAFTGRARVITVDGVGHNIPRDAASVVFKVLQMAVPA